MLIIKTRIIKKGFKDYSTVMTDGDDIAIVYNADKKPVYYLSELNYINNTNLENKILTKNEINKAFIKGIKGYGVVVDHKNHRIIITKDGKKFYCVDIKNQTEEILKILVIENGMTIKYIENQTEELCLIAVAQNKYSLQYIRKQTENICKLALEQDGLLLKCVNEQTEELCKIAVKQNGVAIQYVENKPDNVDINDN